jgi:uncharacterized integral membrane protein
VSRNILFIGLIALVFLFVIQNTEVVEFKFLVWTFAVSRALMLFGTLALGFVAGWLVTYPKRRQAKGGAAKK